LPRWGIIKPSFREEKWIITKGHVQRAFKLLQIQDGIRNAFRTMDAPPKSKKFVPDTPDTPDMDLDGLDFPMVLKHTEVARRLLLKAELREGLANSFTVHSKTIWTIFEKKETEDNSKKVSIKWFRAIARNCPAAIGQYNEAADALEFTLPNEPNDAFDAALKTFANTTVNILRSGAGQKDARGGAREKEK